MKKLTLVCVIRVILVVGWVYLFKKENPVSISRNEDGTLQVEVTAVQDNLPIVLSFLPFPWKTVPKGL